MQLGYLKKFIGNSSTIKNRFEKIVDTEVSETNNLQSNEHKKQYKQDSKNSYNNNNCSSQNNVVKLQQQENVGIIAQLFRSIMAVKLMGMAYYIFAGMIESECPQEQVKAEMGCIDQVLLPNISYWMNMIALSALIMVGILVLSAKKILPRFLSVIVLVQMYYMVFHVYDTDVRKISLRKYGGGHAMFLGICMVVFTIIIGLSNLGYYMYKNHRKQLQISLIIVGLFLVFSGYKFSYSCYDWNQGLDEELDYGNQYCRIQRPTYCWPTIIDNLLDFSEKSCKIKDFQEYREKVLKEWRVSQRYKKQKFSNIDDIQYVSLPYTNKYSERVRVTEGIQKSIIQDSKFHRSEKEAIQSGHESYIDLKNLELKVNVQRNEELVEKRKVQGEGIDSLSRNIIVVYIDTVSRAQMFRKMKKSMQFLKKYARKEEGNQDSWEVDEEGKKYRKNKTVYEFFRFHSVDRNTLNNLTLMHYGYLRNKVLDALKSGISEFKMRQKRSSLFQEFKDAGYIVGHAMNTCTINCAFRSQWDSGNYMLYNYFNVEAADHEFMVMDPLYVNINNYFDTSMGINSVYRRCLYGRDTNEFVFDYGEQFLQKYREEKKVMYLEFTDGHEITEEVLKYIDDPLYNFLNNIEKQGMLEKDTTVYFLSDHGNHQVSTFYLFQQSSQKTDQNTVKDIYSQERTLPMYFMLMTNDVLRRNEELSQNLRGNSQKIFGMGEVRETMIRNAFGDLKYWEKKMDEQKVRRQEVQESRQKRLKHSNQLYSTLFDSLESERSCLDIGMVDFGNPYMYCSCYPQNNVQQVGEQKNQNGKKFISKKQK